MSQNNLNTLNDIINIIDINNKDEIKIKINDYDNLYGNKSDTKKNKFEKNNKSIYKKNLNTLNDIINIKDIDNTD